MIEEATGVKRSLWTLANFYRKYGVKYVQPKYIIASSDSDEVRLKKQQGFIVRLIEEIQAGSEILYFDETSLNLWAHRRKVWIKKDDPFRVRLSAQQGHNLTVLGCISNKRKELCYSID